MDSWRDQILKEFTPKVARLNLIADQGGLLLEEVILESILAPSSLAVRDASLTARTLPGDSFLDNLKYPPLAPSLVLDSVQEGKSGGLLG